MIQRAPPAKFQPKYLNVDKMKSKKASHNGHNTKIWMLEDKRVKYEDDDWRGNVQGLLCPTQLEGRPMCWVDFLLSIQFWSFIKFQIIEDCDFGTRFSCCLKIKNKKHETL